jgi:hypothetical protein
LPAGEKKKLIALEVFDMNLASVDGLLSHGAHLAQAESKSSNESEGAKSQRHTPQKLIFKGTYHALNLFLLRRNPRANCLT